MPACRQTKADWQSCPAGSWAVQRRTDAPPTCDNCAGGECAEWPGSTPQPLFTTQLQQVGEFDCWGDVVPHFVRTFLPLSNPAALDFSLNPYLFLLSRRP